MSQHRDGRHPPGLARAFVPPVPGSRSGSDRAGRTLCDRRVAQRTRRRNARRALDAVIAESAGWSEAEIRQAIEWLKSRKPTTAAPWPHHTDRR